MNRRIAEKNKLSQRLQIHGIELGRVLSEFLACFQGGAPQRCAAHDRFEKVLADEIGGAVVVGRAVGDGCAAKVAIRAVLEICVRNAAVYVLLRLIQFRAVAALDRRHRAGRNLGLDKRRIVRHGETVSLLPVEKRIGQ